LALYSLAALSSPSGAGPAWSRLPQAPAGLGLDDAGAVPIIRRLVARESASKIRTA
jgi:hypothetical protein